MIEKKAQGVMSNAFANAAISKNAQNRRANVDQTTIVSEVILAMILRAARQWRVRRILIL
jgi:hypothetical protein